VLLRSFFTIIFFGKTQEVPLEDAGGGEGWRCRVVGGV
jgi:hypothetical protein